jgi:hypothetical protein
MPEFLYFLLFLSSPTIILADLEDTAVDNGNDITKGGDRHAGAHAVSPSHEDSSEAETGSRFRDETAEPGENSNKMDIQSPSFRIVDIEAPAGLQSILSSQTGGGSARPDPDPPAAPTA